MDDFDFVVSLLAPASDLVSRTAGAGLKATFARAGNNVIHTYSSEIASNRQQNVDVLVGDLFDNSLEEFEVIVGIQEDDPLITLDRNIP